MKFLPFRGPSGMPGAKWRLNGFVRPPELESSVVAKLILAVFPFKEVEESSVKQLPSYEDRNYYLTGVSEGSADENTEGEFVLKISNSLMSGSSVV